ncbi:LPS export ABC transporter permease LptG [Candidatus Venteria ishoeyi]|uniref:Lipopolysaccharide export system permease protein LptG n=1 Tax=Candidatus Venteria ishoeyi TaxID=1899563 RepID=A0A1H6F9Y7_9GAMM|nr:LPS export ABC transporter permease LptG [Candidatus Venteria ishoeyi]SEH06920.1 Lipopolysaccharide export system permease protein LptG [Candidatus Venteria ishoeyi]
MFLKRLDRYIAKTVLSTTLLVLLVLVGLFLFFTFIEELDEIGKGNYSTYHALNYVFMMTPRRTYEFFPIAALLGSLLGLGLLSNNSELTVMRASGVSIMRIGWSLIKVGLALMVLVILLGESVAPYAEQKAKNMRALAQSGQSALNTRHGLWARDGNNFIHIRRPDVGGQLEEVTFYAFDKEQRLQQLTTASSAFYYDKQWVLEDIAQTHINGNQITGERLTWQERSEFPTPNLINVLTMEPSHLSTPELYRYIDYLQQNNLHAAPYELSFWYRMIYPLTTIVSIFLALPFVFGSLRSVAVGQRILVGTLLGIVFYALNQVMGHSALLYGINPLFSALLPTLLFFMLALLLMRRIF